MQALEEQIAEMVIFSEGSISWSEAWGLAFQERQLIIKTVNKLNKAKSGKQGGDFDSNVTSGDFGFDPVDLK